MKILVISDTHRSLKLAGEAIKDHLPADLLIHLGDFIEDGADLARQFGIEFSGVRGNNDYSPGKNELELELNGFRLLAVHGHYFEIDNDLEPLFEEARQRKVNLVLFGHNHKSGIYERDGIYLMNPGNLFLAEKENSLGVIELNQGGMVLSIFNLKQGAFTDVRKIPGGS